MKEKIKQIWLILEMQESSYDTWDEDDEGRLQIIKERCEELIRIKNGVSITIDSLLSIQDYYPSDQ